MLLVTSTGVYVLFTEGTFRDLSVYIRIVAHFKYVLYCDLTTYGNYTNF